MEIKSTDLWAATLCIPLASAGFLLGLVYNIDGGKNMFSYTSDPELQGVTT
jgi:hypothetical protein